MKVFQTGIRNGEFITSSDSGKQNLGSLFQIKGNYPPSKASLPADDYSWSIFLQQLEAIPFFASLTPPERKAWLIENSTDNAELYLQEVPLKVKIIKLEGKHFREKFDQATIDRLTQGNPNDSEGYWDLSYIYNLIPRKPGSRAHRHSLVFRPNNWKIHSLPPEKLDSFTGLVINLDLCSLSVVNNEPINYLIKLDEGIIGIRSSSDKEKLLPDPFPLLDWASPAIHKSLIQKIIRTGADQITHDGTVYSGDWVLRTSFLMLLNHPGSFVPDIQRYVTGQESALKRLAVSICEDSYTPNYLEIVCLLAGALLTQEKKDWNPTREQIVRWLQLAEESRKDVRRFNYSTKDLVSPTTINEYSLSYLLLKKLRSFATDLNMMSTITGEFTTGDSLISQIPLIHCIDQHNITDIVYHFPDGTVYPYHLLVNLIWDHSSGINPRKGKKFNDEQILWSIRYAQDAIWKSKTSTPKDREVIEGSSELIYELSDQWLAGMLGTIPLQMGKNYLLMSLHPDDITTIIPVKKPARGEKDIPQLTIQEQADAIATFQNLLTGGIALKAVPKSLPWFTGASLYLNNGTYYLKLIDGNYYPWDVLKKIQYKFQHHSDLELTLENSLIWTGIGISQSAEAQVEKLLDTTPEVLRRLLMYLSASRSTISLFKVSRDGTGQEYAVSPLDTTIFHLLSKLTLIYPGAIKKLDTRQFRVTYGPLIWTLGERILEKLNKSIDLFGVSEWGKIFDRSKRKPWPHQEVGWQKMLGKRGHLLWIPVGLGKTMIVLRFLQDLIEKEKMPKYVIYTLPPSAIENTLRELQAFGFRTHLMDLRADADPLMKEVFPYMINLVKHDHLKMGGDLFKSIADQSMVIIDEFHLTLNKTLRTSMALELAKTSIDFIGLSGTIVQSENVEDLIQWLQQIVDFEVTTENFWVAISAMISNRVNTGVSVISYSHEIQLPPEVKELYLSLVNSSLGGKNANPSADDFRKAVSLCHEACLYELVNLTIQYYNSGESIFLVAKDKLDQEKMKNLLLGIGMPENEIVLLGKDQSVAISSGSNNPVRVVITTIRHSTGYTFTKAKIMLTSVYFSNQATREQLEGRINRIGQTSHEVYVITVHTGVLTHLLKKYDEARSLSQALKQLAGEI